MTNFLSVIKSILHPVCVYRKFCEACEALEADTRAIEREGKFE